jgi:CheY-like chemotaxis protein
MQPVSTILIVEDSPDDYEFCFTALTQDGNLKNPIKWCQTGDEALDYLCLRGDFADAVHDLPGLILLDLNMPGTGGQQVLQQIKSDERFKRIPVIVMTSSSAQTDVDACYAMGANSYVIKPVDIDGFFTAITRLREYWFQIAVLPK